MAAGKSNTVTRIAVAGISITGLVLIFVLQKYFYTFVQGTGAVSFFVSRTIRFLLNDALTIALIWSLFNKRKYVVFSLWVQLFGFCFILVPYFILKYFYSTYNGPLLSFMHRLILNPTLLLLLIPAFYYQEKITLRSN